MPKSQNLICSHCFKNIQNKCEVICKICQRKFHKICAKVENEVVVNALSCFENIVFNCDNCLQASCDLVKKISLLTYEFEELKTMISQFIGTNTTNNKSKSVSHRSLPVLKTGLDSKLSSNCSSSNLPCIYDESQDVVGVPVVSCVTINAKTVDVDVDAAVIAVAAAANENVGVCAGVENITDVVTDDLNTVVDELVSVNDANSVNSNDWSNVTRRRDFRKRRVAVVGVNNNAELDVVVRKKWVHISSFKPTVTEDNIIEYVSKHLNIDKGHISCFKLVKKDAQIKNLKFVNFKIGITPSLFSELFNSKLWTSDVKVRPFVGFPKKNSPQEQSQKM